MEVAMLYKTLVLNKAKDLYRWTGYTPSTATKTRAHLMLKAKRKMEKTSNIAQIESSSEDSAETII